MAETVLSVQYVRGKATYQYAASVVSQSIFTTGEEEGRSSRIEMLEVLCAVDASPKEKDSRCKKYKRKRRTKARKLSPQAKALKSLRKSKGLSQSEFADELGVAQTMISKIKVGEKTVPQKIAAILNI